MTRIVLLLALATFLNPAYAELRHRGQLGDITPRKLLHGIRNGERLDLARLRLTGVPKDLELELERFEVFKSNARIMLHDGQKTRTFKPRKGGYFKGRVKNQMRSLAVLTVDPSGKTGGVVQIEDRLWLLSGKKEDPDQPLEINSEALPDASFTGPAQPMSCGLDQLKLSQKAPALRPRSLALAAPDLPLNTLSEGQRYQATVAIESDGEFFARFGNALSAEQYVANLFAYLTAVYEQETRTRLVLGYISLWADPATDPWTFTSTSTGLQNFRNYWQANRQNVSRTTAHFLSGKAGGNMNGGIAYLNGLCNSYAYGLSGDLRGTFSLANPQPMWDIYVVAHELGHNFNSEHTHDYQNIGGDANPVDRCELGGPTGPYSPGSLPGLNSLSGGVAGTGNGTLMSYCHQLTGGYNNIALTFGQNHSYGIKPYRVSEVMSDFVSQQASSYPSCLPIVGNHFSLSVTKSGTGSGTVISDPNGINCGATCSTAFSSQQTVVLTATPDAGSVFEGWGTACNGIGPCTVTMSADRTLNANFVRQADTLLTVTASGNGVVTSTPAGIDCGTTCSSRFSIGTRVTLTATPASGFRFAGWTGACSGEGSCTLTLEKATEVNATFTEAPVTVNLGISGGGRINSTPQGLSCTANCSGTFTPGTKVTLTPTPAQGFYFSGWAGACSGQGLCTLTLTGNTSLAAQFTPIPAGNQLLTTQVTGAGLVTSLPQGIRCSSQCQAPFPKGTLVTLFSSPNQGSSFVGWGSACAGKETCSVLLHSDQTVSAEYNSTFLIILPIINSYLNR